MLWDSDNIASEVHDMAQDLVLLLRHSGNWTGSQSREHIYCAQMGADTPSIQNVIKGRNESQDQITILAVWSNVRNHKDVIL